MFQVRCHRLIVIFERGLQTDCRVPDVVDSYPEDLGGQRVQSICNCFVEGRYYVTLGPLYESSYPWQRIKFVFSIIELIGNMGGFLLYYLTLKFQCLDVCCKGFPIFFRGARSNQVSTFPEDRKCITLT